MTRPSARFRLLEGGAGLGAGALLAMTSKRSAEAASVDPFSLAAAGNGAVDAGPDRGGSRAGPLTNTRGHVELLAGGDEQLGPAMSRQGEGGRVEMVPMRGRSD